MKLTIKRKNSKICDKRNYMEVFLDQKHNGLLKGKKPTKYFCSLESKNFTIKIIPKIQKENSDLITAQKEILKEVKNFYQDLYSSKSKESDLLKHFNDDFKNINVPKLSHTESDKLEGPITLQEASSVLKNMKNEKSPGSSGFTSEFYKVFWKSIGPFLVRSLNLSLESGQLSVTQRQGIITCIPKGDKPRQFLKNWRPITLLNTSYKIASGVIAHRIKQHLETLIDPDQTGFVLGRYIGENSLILYDLMKMTEDKNIQGLLLFIDFEKAFDSISWKFLQKVLQLFNFGPSIQKWVNVFYKNIMSAVNQGDICLNFSKSKGDVDKGTLSLCIYLSSVLKYWL